MVAALLLVGCAAVILPFRPSANVAPLGIPRAAWVLCYDTIQHELALHDRKRLNVFSELERQCLETYLLEACGRFLREYGVLEKLWKPSEPHHEYHLFQEHMRLYGERCEDRGGDSEAVRRAVQAFDEQLRREMNLCPTRCEPAR
jgi:hypothetical protein